MAATDAGQAMLRHGNDWPGRAIAAETLVRSLEQELEDTRALYLSARRDVREEFIDREEELEEDVQVVREAYFALVSFIVLHEPVLREYYEERGELPKEGFEQLAHELHTSLVLRLDDVRDAPDVDAGE